MPLSLTKIRSNLYKIVDQAILTGIPVEFKRKGVRVRIVPEMKKSKLDRLKKHSGVIKGNPDDLIHLNWEDEWKESNV